MLASNHDAYLGLQSWATVHWLNQATFLENKSSQDIN
jgi:hypothetical protein